MSNFWKSKMAVSAILKITKITMSPQRLDHSLLNLVRWSKMGLLTAPTVKKFEFQNARCRTAAILKTVKSPYLYNRSTDFDEISHIIASVYAVVQHFTHSKSHPADEKYSLKGAWSGSGERFWNFTPTTANPRDFKFCTRVGHAKS